MSGYGEIRVCCRSRYACAAAFAALCFAAFLVLGLPLRAWAVPTVSIEPVGTIVDPGEEFEVRIMISAEAETISTFDVVYRFNPDVLEMVAAYEGSLYANCPWTTWFVAEEESLGTWEVWDVIFPGGTYVVAPGELARLRFRAKAKGYSDLEFLSAGVCDIERYPLDPLDWEDAFVCVGGGTGLEGGSRPDRLWQLGPPFPNPTRGGTTVPLIGPGPGIPGPIWLVIFDGRGRIVRELCGLSGSASSGLHWDGRDTRGNEVPAGVYFIRFGTPAEAGARKVVVIR
ncbi:MAG: hypothetical protein ABIH26_12505 [Candidatus Eisenbacteria bacterium]